MVNISTAALRLSLIGVLGWTVTAAAHAQSASVGVNFTGVTLADGQALKGFTYAPPDTNGAVGPDSIVEFVNGVYATYDKTGVQTSKISDTNFWTNAGITPNAGVSDTRVIYDLATNHYFASEITTSATGNQVLIARSNTSNPADGWRGTSFIANSGFGDYDTLSLNQDGVYIGTNNFTSSTGSFKSVSFFSIPKADLLASTPTVANMTRFDDRDAVTQGFTLQAALNFGASVGPEPVLSVDITNANTQQIRFAQLTNAAGPGPATLTPGTVAPGAAAVAQPQLARQPDGTQQIDPGDARISGNAVQVGNNVFAVRSILENGHDVIHYTVVDATTGAVVTQGTFSSANTEFDYIYPSIAVNDSGTVVMGYSRSGSAATGAAGDLSAYAVAGNFAGGALTFSTNELLLRQGDVNNYHLFGGNGERWGDYSAVRLDPSNQNSFWAFQEFANGTNKWATQVTQIIIAPEPASLPLLVLGGAGLTGLCLIKKSRRRRVQNAVSR